jgi:hypothetical protein
MSEVQSKSSLLQQRPTIRIEIDGKRCVAAITGPSFKRVGKYYREVLIARQSFALIVWNRSRCSPAPGCHLGKASVGMANWNAILPEVPILFRGTPLLRSKR